MDEFRRYITDKHLNDTDEIMYVVNGEEIPVSVADFISPNFRYTTCYLWTDEYYLLVRQERSDWIDSILCLFMLKTNHAYVPIPAQFIKENKHHTALPRLRRMIKMIRNSSDCMIDGTAYNIDLIVSGDKYLIKELNLRESLDLDEFNSLQMYCSASYSDFRGHNDWDLSFSYR